ncbi:MAG TPA: hypothetical protein VJL32_02240 [Candidatus Paceibacterota bacterium]
MFDKLRPEFIPPEEIKRVNRPNDWAYFSSALREAGADLDKVLDTGGDSELRESIGHYRRALAEVTQTSFARNATDRIKIRVFENRLTKFAGDLNVALIAGNRSMIRSVFERLSFPE